MALGLTEAEAEAFSSARFFTSASTEATVSSAAVADAEGLAEASSLDSFFGSAVALADAEGSAVALGDAEGSALAETLAEALGLSGATERASIFTVAALPPREVSLSFREPESRYTSTETRSSRSLCQGIETVNSPLSLAVTSR